MNTHNLNSNNLSKIKLDLKMFSSLNLNMLEVSRNFPTNEQHLAKKSCIKNRL